MCNSSSRSVRFVLVLGVLAWLPLSAAVADDYVPPIGIPAPSFGINESHTMYNGQYYAAGGFAYGDAGNGPYTHYVDNTHPSATNTDNPYGTPARPRADLFDGSVITLPAGSVVEIHGGPYSYSSQRTISNQGTATNPVFIRGFDENNRVLIQANTRFSMIMAGSYGVIENLELYNGIYFSTSGGAHHISFRHNEVHSQVGIIRGSGSVVYAGSWTDDIVVYDNHLHHMVKANNADCHGVNIGSGSERIWVLDNYIHHNSGDAFQAAHEASPRPRYVYVGRNLMHEDRENGVDLKNIEDVIVSQNTMYGYESSSTSNGDAMVIGSTGYSASTEGPLKSWILFNTIYSSRTGIRVEGAGDCHIIGNLIYNTTGNGIQLDIKPDSQNVNIIGNTIYNVGGTGIAHGGRVGPTDFRFENNIISGVGGRHISLDQEIVRTASLTNNLFWDNGSNINIRWGSTTYIGLSEAGVNGLPDSDGNVIGDPLFVDAPNANFAIPQLSPAMDAGFESIDYQEFFDVYGIEIRVDYLNATRPQENEWDIGALEYSDPTQVVGRWVFYNNSAFDGNDAGLNAADDAARATDKVALLPGETATSANYTSYSRGINGLMVDIHRLDGTPTGRDFEFKVGIGS